MNTGTPEQLRLESLMQYGILDTDAEASFDDLTTLAAQICSTPIALISLLDDKRQWFKSRRGITVCETPREDAFCAHTVETRAPFIVEDARSHPLLKHNRLVTGAPHIRFYAGVPLITPDGFAVGTLCVLDHVPRGLRADQIETLQVLARQVVLLLEMKKNLLRLEQTMVKRDEAEEALRQAKKSLECKVVERSRLLSIEVAERIKERDISNALINSLPGIFYVLDPAGQLLRWNDNTMTVTGYTAAELHEMHMCDFFDAAQRPMIEGSMQEVLQTGKTQVEADLLTKDGRRIAHLFSGSRVNINGCMCAAGTGVDITRRKQSESSLREAEERYRKLVELSPDAIFVLKHGRCVFANAAAVDLVGAESIEPLLASPFMRFVHPDFHASAVRALGEQNGERHAPRLEEKLVQLSGHVIDVEIAAASFLDEGQPAQLVIARDVTEVKRYQSQLEKHANYDALTHLANRNLLQDRILQAMARADRDGSAAVVAFIDLDNFKLVNDTLGHNIGDLLLVAVGHCLTACVREGDTVGRHGGDEFVLVMNVANDDEAPGLWMGRLLNIFSKPLAVAEHHIFVSCSVGVSIYPRDGTSAQALLKNADAAMYQAKAAGRNQFKFFTPGMNDKVRERFTLESKLRQAMERDELSLNYQPQVDLSTGKVIGTEALLRWKIPGEGYISPAKFIPIAEESGLIVTLGEWVLQQACRDNKSLQDAGLAAIPVSVNLSARQFYPVALVKSVRAALEISQLRAEFLKLEVTETTVTRHPEEAQEILQELKDMGVRLAIDDFGIGYSSLSYLQRFPMDQLKIDQSFIRDVAVDPSDAAIAQAVITLGHSLNLNVIAEGVHSLPQIQFLRAHDCDAIQGNYFCKAVPLDDLRLLLQSKRQLPLH